MKKRAKKQFKTPLKNQRMNDIYSKKKLLNHIKNKFIEGDSFVTLFYNGTAPTVEEMKRDYTAFMCRLKYMMKKKGLKLEYVGISHRKMKKGHHHIILNISPHKFPEELWTCGRVEVKALVSDPEIVFEQVREFLKDDNLFLKRWCASKK